MKAILRPRIAALLALLALPFLFNSCTPTYDQAYYGTDGYSAGSTTVYQGGSNYYRPAPVPIVASSLYVSSTSHRCNVCSYSPCRCSSPYRGHSSYYRPTAPRTQVVHVPTHHRSYSPSYSRSYSPSYSRGYSPSYNRGNSSTSNHNRSNGSSHRSSASDNRGNQGRGSSPSLHRNSSPSTQRSNISPRYTTTSTITPSPRRPAAVPTRTLKPQTTTRPTTTRLTPPTRVQRPTQSTRPTSRPTTSRPTTSRPTTSRPTSSRPTSSRPSAPRQSSTPAPAPTPARRNSHSGVNPPDRTKVNGPAMRGKPRG